MAHKIFIDDANGHPKVGFPSIELNDDSIVFTPKEGRNLYS